MSAVPEKHIQSNLVNPTLFVSHVFTPDCKVSGLSNQPFMTENYHGYVIILTLCCILLKRPKSAATVYSICKVSASGG